MTLDGGALKEGPSKIKKSFCVALLQCSVGSWFMNHAADTRKYCPTGHKNGQKRPKDLIRLSVTDLASMFRLAVAEGSWDDQPVTVRLVPEPLPVSGRAQDDGGVFRHRDRNAVWQGK